MLHEAYRNSCSKFSKVFTWRIFARWFTVTKRHSAFITPEGDTKNDYL
jgi:hypothetical protein